ncbi:MAG TPA: hypothetical protein VF886_17710 [Roseiarcus sp.]
MTRSSPFKFAMTGAVAVAALCAAAGTAKPQFKKTDLVSDIGGLATITDPNLINTWGLTAILGGSPFWVNNQGTGTSSLFSVTGRTGVAAANVLDPPATNFSAIPPGTGMGIGPTGIVANSKMTSFDIGTTGPAFSFSQI